MPIRSLLLSSLACLLMLVPPGLSAESREFDLTIEDTRVRLVDTMTYHTSAFNGQVPGPLFHVREGDEVTVNVTNLTTLTHTIHWHGLLQKNNWRNDGVPDVTQKAIEPGETFTYKFIAEPAGTMWYHCHVNVNEHVALRGMWGPFIIDRKEPLPIEKEVTRDFVLMMTEWASKWADRPGEGGLPGDVFDYFTINGKSAPEAPPLKVKEGDMVRLRLIGAGDHVHSIHLHGHVFTVAFKDGHPLPNPFLSDTLLVGPGERYDIFFRADNPGRWMVHDHVDTHTVNGTKPMGGSMTVVEYEGIPVDDWYAKGHGAHSVPDFYYEDSLKKPHGMHENPAFKGEPVE
jgi:FtsP/CotA-like multicopper oxidase with cupredoxin domain